MIGKKVKQISILSFFLNIQYGFVYECVTSEGFPPVKVGIWKAVLKYRAVENDMTKTLEIKWEREKNVGKQKTREKIILK